MGTDEKSALRTTEVETIPVLYKANGKWSGCRQENWALNFDEIN